jgi:hypothetical protein
MVFGALIAGVLVGTLVPSPKSPSATSSVVAPPFVSQEKAEAKAKRESAGYTKEKDNPAATEKENTAREAVQVPSPSDDDAKSVKQETKPCSQQTWPYYSASCIDRSAQAPSSYQVTNTRPADPTIALRNEENQTATPAPTRETRQTPKASAPAQNEEKPRQRQQRAQPRYTRIEPPDYDFDYARTLLRRDGTRIYVLPEGRAPRGYWPAW